MASWKGPSAEWDFVALGVNLFVAFLFLGGVTSAALESEPVRQRGLAPPVRPEGGFDRPSMPDIDKRPLAVIHAPDVPAESPIAVAPPAVSMSPHAGEHHEARKVEEPGRGDQVVICHRPPGNPQNAHILEVGAAAVSAHLAHGDSLGECPGAEHSDGPKEPGHQKGHDRGQGPPDRGRGPGGR